MRKVSKTGIVRSRFDLFVACKDTQRRKKESRFARKTNKQDELSIQDKGLLNKDNLIELATMTSLPPEWMDKYEDCQIHLREVDEIRKQVANLYARRLNTINENEEHQLDRLIFEKAQEAIKKIALSDRLLKEIRESGQEEGSDKQVCNNLTIGLAVTIQQKTRQVRAQQRSYIEQRRRLENSGKVSFLELAVEKTLGGDIYEDDMMEMKTEDLEMETRSKEILKLVDTINELSEIYKQLNSLVLVQGTLLDRIDANLDSAVSDVKKGKESIKKALDHQKSPLACRIIMAMVVLLLILGIVLIVKHAN